MNVLSLFDGISCGQLALQRANIKVDNYFASEIDKHAIKVTMKNFPNTKQLGDIKKINIKELPQIDLLIGGSPCQGFSQAGNGFNFDDPRSRLFFEYVRILKEVKPKYFLLENVKMKKEWKDIISEYMGVKPIEINSNLVSAQNRRRLYWTNIPNIILPKDKNIVFGDIKDNNVKADDKNRNINNSNIKRFLNNKTPLILNNDKTRTLLLRQNLGFNNAGFVKDDIGLRYLSVLEYERLQTLPDNYTDNISNPQRYKCIGNGWTVDIITHILKNINGLN